MKTVLLIFIFVILLGLLISVNKQAKKLKIDNESILFEEKMRKIEFSKKYLQEALLQFPVFEKKETMKSKLNKWEIAEQYINSKINKAIEVLTKYEKEEICKHTNH